MRENESKVKVIFCTFSNFESGAYGDATNDRKLFSAIPMNYEKIALFPKYTETNKISIKSILKLISIYLKEIIASNRIFITRGPKLAILPILLKKLFRNVVIMRGGCTPLMFVERKAFSNNINFHSKDNIIQKIIYFIEPQLEKFTLRHADYFIVENIRTKRLVSYYGANSSKVKIIPYYVPDYFLRGKNPIFDKKKDIFKIGYVGRFKQYDLLFPIIKAICLLKEQKLPIKLYLIGDGPKKDNVEKMVKNLNLSENVEILGAKSHTEVSEIIENFHCMLLPMLTKLCPSTISIKILEGVMKGKIIITTKSGNNPSLFLEHTDLILKNSSQETIAENIKSVIENYEYYRKIAESLSIYHSNFRSRKDYEEKLYELFSN